MARIAILDTNGNRYPSTDSEDNTEEGVKEFANFIARIQSGDMGATSAVELETDEGILYLMPNAVVAVARVVE